MESTVIVNRYLDFYAFATDRITDFVVDLSTIGGAMWTSSRCNCCTASRSATRDGFLVAVDLQIEAIAERVTAQDWTIEFRMFSADAIFAAARSDVAVWDTGLWGY